MVEQPCCPVCGGSVFAFEGVSDETGEIKIVLRCGDEDYALEISTGLTEEDLDEMHEVGKPTPKEMVIKLLFRESES